MSLADVPGLGGYLQQKALNQQETLQNLQQASQATGLEGALQRLQNLKSYMGEVAALGPNPDPSSVAAIATRYAEPGDALKVSAASQAAHDRLEQAHQQELAAYALRLSQATSQAQRDAETARHNRAMEGLQAQIAAMRGQGAVPSGYRRTTSGDLEAIPGGPADTKRQMQLSQDTTALNASISDMDRLAAAANELKNSPGLAGITGLRGAIPNIPGTAAANAQAALEALKSQIAFSVLQNMRNNSKTGGALGQVSNIEEQMLQNNLGALERSQSYEEYQKNLQKIIDYTTAAKDRLRGAYNTRYSSPAAPSAAPSSQAPATSGGWSIKPLP